MNSKSAITLWKRVFLAALLSGLTVEALAQGRGFGGGGFGGGGGGGGGGGFGGRGGAGATTQYPAPGQVGEALITSYPDTKQIMVITDADTAAQMKSVIESLDRPVPQVLIKVVFLEATYRDGLDIGLEGGVKLKNNSTSIGLTNAFGLLQQGAAAFVPYTTLPGAGLYTVMGQDFIATLRAIAEGGKLEVLSRPSILARNNQLATISVGQSVPFIDNVTFVGPQSTPQNNITYRDIGIILNVTPFITADGMVEMIVQPEISALSGESIPISSGPSGLISAPIVNTRRADTVVVTPDGQTVTIGGLLQNTENGSESKIPLLGDIPVLGNLFKRQVKQKTKTELLIFITPHIVLKKDQLAAMTQRETDQASRATSAFGEEELHRYLDGFPVKPAEATKGTKASKSNGKSSKSK